MRSGRIGAVAAAIVAVALTLSACASGTDAVAQGGTFDFVSPGGQTQILYDPPGDRGTLGTLSGPDLMNEGKTLSLSDFDGKVVVLNVWGQWCGPCRGEVKYLEETYEQTKALGVAFLGIDVRDNEKDKAQDFVTDRKVSYPSIYDPAARTLLALGAHYPASVVPTTLVLDRGHRVAAVFLKAVSTDDLKPVVERVARES